MQRPKIGVVIPAHNEEDSIALVLDAIPRQFPSTVVVVDNNSTDQTAHTAREHGAVVLREKLHGYGRVVQTGLRHFKDHPVDIVVFLDGDYSDYPEEMGQLIAPIMDNGYDMVLSTRLNPLYDKKSLSPHVIYGNKLVVFLINRFFATEYTDLGPFRAIRYDALKELRMEDNNYGWTVEMQVKARLHRLKVKEVPVHYRARIGTSKISGTIKGSLLAGTKMIYTILKLLPTRPGSRVK
ncbi:MAG: glycosyltransferase family 2 protein [Gammaproteobacteria bacterium]|nr:glycosyltransferase family 2 protein [Gammaproteobacteria bacterium]